jgi:peptide-methionine (S)-S-oxide reductase
MRKTFAIASKKNSRCYGDRRKTWKILVILVVVLFCWTGGGSGEKNDRRTTTVSAMIMIAHTSKSNTRTSSSSSSTSTTCLEMNFLSNFFDSLGGGGGSYNLEIDYDTLTFPGPEIGMISSSLLSPSSSSSIIQMPSNSPSIPNLELVTIAGGCFWGLELALQRLDGIKYTLVGYTQGLDKETKPNYEQVSSGNTNHCEAVIVYYDPSIVSYDTVIRAVLDRVDVTTVNGQGRDYGKQYRTGIYFHTTEQREIAQRMLSEELIINPKYNNNNNNNNKKIKIKIATELKPAKAFWPAEEYHQQYLEKRGQSSDKGNDDEIRCYG